MPLWALKQLSRHPSHSKSTALTISVVHYRIPHETSHPSSTQQSWPSWRGIWPVSTSQQHSSSAIFAWQPVNSHDRLRSIPKILGCILYTYVYSLKIWSSTNRGVFRGCTAKNTKLELGTTNLQWRFDTNPQAHDDLPKSGRTCLPFLHFFCRHRRFFWLFVIVWLFLQRWNSHIEVLETAMFP